VSTENPASGNAVTAVPGVVTSENAFDICAATSSSCACASGRILSRICRYAAISPDWIAPELIRSIEPPPGVDAMTVPRPLLVGSGFHCTVGVTVPWGANDRTTAWVPTSSVPEPV